MLFALSLLSRWKDRGETLKKTTTTITNKNRVSVRRCAAYCFSFASICSFVGFFGECVFFFQNLGSITEYIKHPKIIWCCCLCALDSIRYCIPLLFFCSLCNVIKFLMGPQKSIQNRSAKKKNGFQYRNRKIEPKPCLWLCDWWKIIFGWIQYWEIGGEREWFCVSLKVQWVFACRAEIALHSHLITLNTHRSRREKRR